MSKHTPGPWAVTSVSMNTGNISVGHRDLRIVIAEVTNAASFGDMMAGAMKRGGGGFEQDDCHTQLANARLIAAAPDLLASLKEAIEIIEKHVPIDALGVDHMGDFSVPGGVMTWGVLDEHLHYMRKSVAKAEGRS